MTFEISAQLIVSAVIVGVMLHVILGTVAYLIYVERKASAYIQDRLGPNRVGPFGLLQPIADGLKFLLKEDYTPRNVDKVLFTLAPMVMVIPALIGWAIIPWGGYWVTPEFTLPLIGTIESQKVLVAAANINVGVVYLLAVASMSVYGVTLGGWASNNKYSFFGGLRCSAGMISYEIPLALAVLAILLMSGTVYPQSLIELQVSQGWFLLAQPIAAILFIVCMLAESNRAPFDNAEAEQELVGGYHTEYSSMRFALYFLAEYAHLMTGAAFFTLLFLGGYHLPFIPWLHPESTGLGAMLLKFVVFFTKTLLIVFVAIWIRWTLPRVRWDQVMKLAWNSLIPIGITVVIATSIMVYKGWTNTLPMLLMNLGLMVFIVLIQPMLPHAEDVNRRVPMYGSRFNPLPGERASTSPTTAEALHEAAPQLRATR